jgi:hypothetical protein
MSAAGTGSHQALLKGGAHAGGKLGKALRDAGVSVRMGRRVRDGATRRGELNRLEQVFLVRHDRK